MKLHELRLGGCVSRAEALYKIQSWAKNAKSFTILSVYRYWYGVGSKNKNTFSFEVQYFSTAKEGKYQIPKEVGILNGASRRKHGGNMDDRTVLVKNNLRAQYFRIIIHS